MEIKLNLTAIEKTLSSIVEKSYAHLGKTYLVIEELKVQTEDLDETSVELFKFDYFIVGRYGVEEKKNKRFEFLASSNWDYTFLAGYFTRIIDEVDENE